MESRRSSHQLRTIKETTVDIPQVNEANNVNDSQNIMDGSNEIIEIHSDDENNSEDNEIEVISATQRETQIIDLDEITYDENDTQDVEITGNSNTRRRQSDGDVQIINEIALPQQIPEESLFRNLIRQFHDRSMSSPSPLTYESIQQLGRNFRTSIYTPLGEIQQEDENVQDLINLERQRANPLPSHLASNRRVATRRRLLRNSNLRQQGENIRRYHGVIRNVMAGYRSDPDYSEYNEANDYDNAVENSIMQRIERENELAVDTRLANEQVFNRKTLLEKKEIAKKEIAGYTNNIKESVELCCELCGVILGDGIEEDFKPDSRYNNDMERYMKMYRVHAPWFCIKQCTHGDIDLSKRIFRARCGHVFCGRCVRNIGNKPRKLKSMGITIDNPLYYAPKKCPAEDCKKQFTAKGFKEAYF
jgi:predicted RNase H-related nuclease YkuK (DUF458 family)